MPALTPAMEQAVTNLMKKKDEKATLEINDNKQKNLVQRKEREDHILHLSCLNPLSLILPLRVLHHLLIERSHRRKRNEQML